MRAAFSNHTSMTAHNAFACNLQIGAAITAHRKNSSGALRAEHSITVLSGEPTRFLFDNAITRCWTKPIANRNSQMQTVLDDAHRACAPDT